MDRCCMQKPSILDLYALLTYPEFLHCQLCRHHYELEVQTFSMHSPFGALHDC